MKYWNILRDKPNLKDGNKKSLYKEVMKSHEKRKGGSTISKSSLLPFIIRDKMTFHC